jgi:poly(beta-D-mannuronate) lyase
MCVSKLSAAILAACMGAAASPAVTNVTNLPELNTALDAAKPGDTIVLRDGSWRDAAVVLRAAGAANAPITVRAETPGMVVFTGASSLTFAAPWVTVEGVRFQDGAIPKGSVITFGADHCRLIESAVLNYNPAELTTAYYWVFFEGSDNSVDRCLFARKNHMGPLVGNAIMNARRNSVTGSYIRDIGSSGGRNGMEIFRIWGYGGSEELGDDGAFFTIEGNLFDHADGESMEIISLKSNRNRVARNTIRATLGGITNRSGNFNTIYGNVILCDGRKGAYGMRIAGQHHVISSNYIERCDYGFMLLSGEYIDRDLTGKYDPIKREGTPLGRVPRYGWVREIELEHNTVVDSAGPELMIGGNYKSGWPAQQRILLPEDNHIDANTFVKTGAGGVSMDEAAQDSAPPLDSFHFKPNRYDGNLISGGEVRLNPLPTKGLTIWKSGGVNVPSAKPLTPEQVGPRWAQSPFIRPSLR